MEKIPKEVFEKKAHEQGYQEGLVMGELKAMARIKKSINSYIDEQQKLYDTTDGEQGYNFDNCDGLETTINKIIMGEKL